jgi:hypothetical protein
MTIAADLMSRAAQLSDDRQGFEADWDEIARYCLPQAETSSNRHDFRRLDQKLNNRSRAVQRAPEVFDSSSITLVTRLAAGMESLTAPQAEKWHGLDVDDPFGAALVDADEEWLERVRDYQFTARYDPRSGFQTAFQSSLRRQIAFGTAIVETEEAFGAANQSGVAVPVYYRHIPLAQCYLATNAQGVTDTNFRRFSMTARQLVEKFGADKVSEKVKAAAEDEKRRDEPVDLLHATMPRAEAGSSRGSNRNSPFATYWLEVDTKHLITDGGFFEFPYHVFYWEQRDDSAYGESPVMQALADIRRFQNMSKHGLRAFQQWTDPPLATVADGQMKRPNLNPRALNPGALDERGEFRVRPLVTAQRPDFALEILNAQKENLRESLYINLFQAMIDRPDSTATAAMIRADEKAQLLGPAGAKIHGALASMIEREFAIMTRKGAFETGSRLAPPETLQDREIKVKFTSPLDRMRRSNEVLGIQQTLEMAGALAQLKGSPAVLDRIDEEKALDITREVVGAPAGMMRDDESVERIRANRADQQQMVAAQQAMQLVQGTSQSASAASQAMSDVSQAANENPEMAEMLAEAAAAAG